MAYHSFKKTVSERLADIRAAGLYKSERQILGPQGAEIRVAQGKVLNLCANNYLGLANHPDIRQAAADGLQGAFKPVSSVTTCVNRIGID